MSNAPKPRYECLRQLGDQLGEAPQARRSQHWPRPRTLLVPFAAVALLGGGAVAGAQLGGDGGKSESLPRLGVQLHFGKGAFGNNCPDSELVVEMFAPSPDLPVDEAEVRCTDGSSDPGLSADQLEAIEAKSLRDIGNFGVPPPE